MMELMRYMRLDRTSSYTRPRKQDLESECQGLSSRRTRACMQTDLTIAINPEIMPF